MQLVHKTTYQHEQTTNQHDKTQKTLTIAIAIERSTYH